MAIVTLSPVDPVEQFPRYDYLAELDGAEFRIVLQYDQRPDRWFLSVFDADDVPIMVGLKLVPDFAIGFRHRFAEGAADGIFKLIDNEKSGLPCGFEQLGREFLLTFAPIDDLNEVQDVPFVIDVLT